MKKTLYIVCLAISASLLSCVKESSHDEQTTDARGGFSIIANTVNIKTVNDGLATIWAAQDQINVFHATSGSNEYTSDGVFTIAEADLPDGRFRGEIAGTLEEGTPYDWVLYYPFKQYNTAIAGAFTIPTSQIQGENNSTAHLAGPAFPLYAKTSAISANATIETSFSHLASIIRVRVTNHSNDILKVTEVNFNASETITGNFSVDLTSTKPVITALGSNTTDVTLKVENGSAIDSGSSADFYIGIAPITIKSGKPVTLTINGYEKTLNLERDADFKAGTIKTLNFNYDKPYADGVTITAKFTAVDFKESKNVGGGLYWNPCDSITVISGGKAINFISDSDIASAEATFSNKSVKSIDSDAIAVYPANPEYKTHDNCVIVQVPGVQTASPCRMSGPALIAISEVHDDQLVFQPACAIVGIKVRTEGIKKIRIQGYNNESLSGTAQIGMDNYGKPGIYEITDENSSIILYPEGETFETDTWYYFTVLPVNILYGLIFSLEKNEEFGQDLFVMRRYLFGGNYFELGELDSYITIGKVTLHPLTITSTGGDFILAEDCDCLSTSSGQYSIYGNDKFLLGKIYTNKYGVTTIHLRDKLTPDTDYVIRCALSECKIHTPAQDDPDRMLFSCNLRKIYSTYIELTCQFTKGKDYFYTLDGSEPGKDNGLQIDPKYVTGGMLTVPIYGLEPNTVYQIKIKASDSSGTDYDTCVLDFQTAAGTPKPSLKADVSSISYSRIELKVTMKGTTSYFLAYKGKGTGGSYTKYTSSGTVSFSSLKPSTEYYFTLVPYDSAGNSGEAIELCAKTADIPYENYFYYQGTYYEITSGKAYTDKNAGNSNWKFLRFNTSSSTTFIEFSYHVPYTEGINSTWSDGTYKIYDSGGFYTYICYFNTGSSSVKYAEGTLNIKTLKGVKQYTFELEDTSGKPLTGFVLANY